MWIKPSLPNLLLALPVIILALAGGGFLTVKALSLHSTFTPSPSPPLKCFPVVEVRPNIRAFMLNEMAADASKLSARDAFTTTTLIRYTQWKVTDSETDFSFPDVAANFLSPELIQDIMLPLERDRTLLRYRIASLDEASLFGGKQLEKIRVGDRIRIALFPDADYDLRCNEIETTGGLLLRVDVREDTDKNSRGTIFHSPKGLEIEIREQDSIIFAVPIQEYPWCWLIAERKRASTDQQSMN